MNLNSVKMFVHVVDKGSFSAASKFLNIPVATVSRRVSELEQSLKLRLLERTTRQLRLTEAGAIFYEFSSRGIEELNAGLLALQEQESELSGRLRLSIPPNFEPWWELIHDFQCEYPNIRVDIFASERKLDLVEEGIDVSLRVGELEVLSSVARQIFQYRHILVAAPNFIEQHGMPKSIHDLTMLPCAAWSKKEQEVSWILGGEKTNITPYIRANDYPHMRFLALQGTCVTELPLFLCRQQLSTNQLIEILPDKPLPIQQLNLIYPSRKQLSKISRVYIDFCLENYEKYLGSH